MRWPLRQGIPFFLFLMARTVAKNVVQIIATGNSFNPSNVTTPVQSEIQVIFTPGTVRFVQSSESNPCVPAGGGLDSETGQGAVGPAVNGNFTFTLTSPDPIFFFNFVDGRTDLCEAGFVGAFNAPTAKFNKFLANAQGHSIQSNAITSTSSSESSSFSTTVFSSTQAQISSTKTSTPSTSKSSTISNPPSSTSTPPSTPSTSISTLPSPSETANTTAIPAQFKPTSNTATKSVVGGFVALLFIGLLIFSWILWRTRKESTPHRIFNTNTLWKRQKEDDPEKQEPLLPKEPPPLPPKVPSRTAWPAIFRNRISDATLVAPLPTPTSTESDHTFASLSVNMSLVDYHEKMVDFRQLTALRSTSSNESKSVAGETISSSVQTQKTNSQRSSYTSLETSTQ